LSEGWRDPYTIPGTNVLINKLGLAKFEVLRQAEYDLARARVEELQVQPVAGRFDLKHLQDMHRHVFQDVYEWAGQLRTVDISKGDHHFVPAERLRSVGTMVFGLLAAEQHLRGREKPEFLDGLTKHYAAINALHPFREGNGRSTQAFIADLARQAGFLVDYTKVDKEHWNDAARRSFMGDVAPMRDVFAVTVSPARAIAFDRLSRDDALKSHPELLPAYERLDAFNKTVVTLSTGTRVEAEVFARAAVSRALHDGAVLGSSADRRLQAQWRGIER
jgi:cell filamentation protein